MAKLLDMTAQGRNRDFEFPKPIAEAMRLAGIRSSAALARAASVSPMTVRRLFNGENNHRALRAYKRVSEALGWSLEELFSACLSVTPEQGVNAIKERMAVLNLTPYKFIQSTRSGGYLGNADHMTFTYMGNYQRISQALNMVPDHFYEVVLMQKDVADSSRADTISEQGNQITRWLLDRPSAA